MKFHYLSYVLRTLGKNYDPEAKIPFDKIIKKVLSPVSPESDIENVELFVQDALKAYPYVEMPLFSQIAHSCGAAKGAWALDTLQNVIYVHDSEGTKFCATCASENKDARKCSKCLKILYCDQVCQKLHWPVHKKICK